MSKTNKELNRETREAAKMSDNVERSMRAARDHYRCKCRHQTDDGSIENLRPYKAKEAHGRKLRDNGNYYQCPICGEVFNIAPITEEEFLAAMDIVISAGSLTKVKMDYKTEKDRELGKKIGEYLWLTRTLLPDMYNMISKNGKGKKKKHNRNPYADRISVSR